MPITQRNKIGMLEAMLFANAEPVETDRLAEAMRADPAEVLTLLEKLQKRYDETESGLMLLHFDGDRWQMATRPYYGEVVKRILDTRRNAPLSPAALEVLAIIAYNQPVGILFAGIFRRAFRFLGLAHRGVQIPRTAAQLRRHLLAGAVLDQTAGQLRFHAFRFRAAWQQQGAFHLNQVRGHINEFAGDFQLIGLHGLDGGSILLNEFHDIDIIEVHFIFANQIEQQIQRTFKIIFL